RKTLYTVLARLEDRQMITKRRSTTDSRRWVYAVPEHTTNDSCTTESINSTSGDSPPPSDISNRVELSHKTTTPQRFESSQQIVNTQSTDSQHPPKCGEELNSRNPYETKAVEVKEISQQTSIDERERGGVECFQSGGVLQDDEALDSHNEGNSVAEVTASDSETVSSDEKENKALAPIEWGTYQGEVYLVAQQVGERLSLRKSGCSQIAHRVRLSDCEVGGRRQLS
ncbi:MAG: hypothetical protein ACRDEA_07535, partial [Microcystaceae cyanobacterium]